MICNKCKKEITDDSKFCEYCGNSISDTEHISPPTITIKPIIITIVCVIICVAIFIAWSLIQKNNKNSNNSQSKVQYYNNISTSSNEEKKIETKQDTQPKRISLFDLQDITYKTYSIDDKGGYDGPDSFVVLAVYQVKAEQYNDLLYTYKMLTNKRRNCF